MYLNRLQHLLNDELLVAAFIRRVVAQTVVSSALRRLILPFAVPSFSFVQAWHERNDDKGDHRGLREQIGTVMGLTC